MAARPGLEGLTLLEDALDAALTRAATPGYAGVLDDPAPSPNGAVLAVR